MTDSKEDRRKKTLELLKSLPDLFEHDATGGIRCVDDYDEEGNYMPNRKWEESRKKKEDLMKKYPLLYGDRNKPMNQTAMCWGLDVGDGWLSLIDELSAKLEKDIQKFLDENGNLECECGHHEEQHYVGEQDTDFSKCSYIFTKSVVNIRNVRGYVVPKNPIKKFFVLTWKKMQGKFLSLVYRFFWWLAENTPINKKEYCSCKGYYPQHPKASQVKEKYGGLRFYMTCSSDEMEKMIDEAEAKAIKTCEECGKPGELCVDYSWYKTMCPDCVELYNQEGREYIQCSKIKEEEEENE